MWKPLGTFNMTPGQNHRVEISDRVTAGTVLADAVTFEWTGLTPPTATWTPALSRRDLYDVQARWPLSVPFQAPEANYKAVHEGGGTTITVNQQTNTGQWNTLSSGLILDPAAGHRLELPGKASGPWVFADAARFVPSALPRNVTWTFTPSSTGAHLIYAKWPAAAAHATQAKFTISHAGGSTDVHVNQRILGGQWVLLGAYSMNASTEYSIALSDNPNGQVAADAVRIVSVVTSAEKFTWTPTIPSSGSYDVYARWEASSANTGSATYMVTHDGGTTNVIVNQKQNGGTWVKLGSYSFTPSSGHKVELLGANDGRVVADGIRLVAASAQAANIAYIHTDHLGSPQKMTDPSQALTWDAQFDPFGEEFLISGSAVQPNRFPGQYADAETGYSYNYFRDYDPAIGRYVQSDPFSWSVLLQTYRGVQLTAPSELAAVVSGAFDLSRRVLNVRLQEELREGGFWDGYTYARNSPVTLIDPTGEQAFGESDRIDGWSQLCANSDCEEECTKQYDKDSEKCRKVRNPRARALCWAGAMAKYGICLAGC